MNKVSKQIENDIIELNKLCSIIYAAECFSFGINEKEIEIRGHLIIYYDEQQAQLSETILKESEETIKIHKKYCLDKGYIRDTD